MRFTIGIPAFKAAFLKECINSVLTQSFTDFELIVINDASPDAIDEIVLSFNDKRIRYYKNDKNTGAENVVNNWNKCLDSAVGEYFILLGDDDKLEPDYLEEFNGLILKYSHLDVFHCRSKIIDGNSEIIGLTPSWPEFESVYDNIWHRLSGYRIQYISDFVYRTDALKNEGGFYFIPLAWGSDDITSYRQMLHKGIAHTNQCLLNYRNSPVTISNSGNIELKLLAIQKEKYWFMNFVENAQPVGQDKNILKNIKELLPDYFSNKIKFTISLAYQKKFSGGISLVYNQVKNKQITYRQGMVSVGMALKSNLKSLLKK